MPSVDVRTPSDCARAMPAEAGSTPAKTATSSCSRRSSFSSRSVPMLPVPRTATLTCSPMRQSMISTLIEPNRAPKVAS